MRILYLIRCIICTGLMIIGYKMLPKEEQNKVSNLIYYSLKQVEEEDKEYWRAEEEMEE